MKISLLWQPTGRVAAQVFLLDLRVGRHLAPFYIYQMNRVNLQWFCHDDSTINIGICIIIVIIIMFMQKPLA